MDVKNLLPNIMNWTSVALSAVAVAEATMQNQPGSAKQQLAINIIKNEAGLADQITPENQPVIDGALSTIVNGIVLACNVKGLFGHRAGTTVAAPSPTPAQ